MQDVILITVSGEDKPGLSTSLLGILAQYDAKILDIGQATSGQEGSSLNHHVCSLCLKWQHRTPLGVFVNHTPKPDPVRSQALLERGL